MPTSQIRQAAVGMLGAHLANSCTNFKKQHEASGKFGFTIPITDRARQIACCAAISGSCRARTKRRSLRLRPRCCRSGAGRAGRDGPAGFDVLMGDPIDIPERILPTKLVSR